MTRLTEEALDSYTRFALPLILARFPDWEPFGVLRPHSAGGWVEFNIACHNPAVETGLYVSTADEELTVGFDTNHSHFTDYENRTNPIELNAGLDEAASYLNERVGVVTWYHNDQWAGSMNCDLPLVGPLPRIFSQHPVTRGTLRSWSGRYDRDEP